MTVDQRRSWDVTIALSGLGFGLGLGLGLGLGTGAGSFGSKTVSRSAFAAPKTTLEDPGACLGARG